MAVDCGEALAGRHIKRQLNHRVHDVRIAVLREHANTFKLCELREPAYAHRPGRSAFDKTQNMSGTEIVAIKFFLVRTFLLRHEHGGTNRKSFCQAIMGDNHGGGQVHGNTARTELDTPTARSGRSTR